MGTRYVIEQFMLDHTSFWLFSTDDQGKIDKGIGNFRNAKLAKQIEEREKEYGRKNGKHQD